MFKEFYKLKFGNYDISDKYRLYIIDAMRV